MPEMTDVRFWSGLSFYIRRNVRVYCCTNEQQQQQQMHGEQVYVLVYGGGLGIALLLAAVFDCAYMLQCLTQMNMHEYFVCVVFGVLLLLLKYTHIILKYIFM